MVREALNSALDEEMSADPNVFLMGEEVRTSEKWSSSLWTNVAFHFLMFIFCLSSAGWGVSGCIQGNTSWGY